LDVPAIARFDTSIVGAWHHTNPSNPSDPESVLALMADGTFYKIEASGFERGRYFWNPVTGAIKFVVLQDTNGDAGFSDLDGLTGPTAIVTGDTLTLLIGTTTTTGTRITGGQHSIVGGWSFGDARQDDNSGVLVFLPDGSYFLAEDRVPTPFTSDGIEIGTYSWDPVTGSINATATIDTNGEAGLSAAVGLSQTGVVLPSVDGLQLGNPPSEAVRIVDPNTVVPVITSPLIATGKVGVPFAYTVAATWAGTFGAAGLPGGLVLDTTTGIVSGTPTASGDFTVTISAANSFALTGSAVLTMTIAPSLSATLLNVSNASTVFGGATVLSATLTSGGVPVAGQMVSFQVNGVAVGVAATNGSGTATLGGVTLAGIPAGTYAAGVQATYAGDATHAGASGAAALSVAKATPVITWPAPASLAHGTPLSGTQLNATASVAGTFVYTPATGTTLPIGDAQVLSTAFTPADAANYTTASAQVTIDVVDTAPIARNGAISTLEDTAVSGSLSATDPDGDPVTFQIVAQPTRGTVVLTNPATGAFTYTPAANRSGGDSFTFQATDGVLTSNVATVTVDVAPVNDPPVAQNIVVTTEEGTAGTGLLVALDADGDPLTFSVVTPPANGTVTIADPATGAFAYTPNGGAFGYDPFTFRVTDAAGASSTATGMPFIVANSPRWPGQTVRASVSSAGTEGNRPQNPSVSRPALSGDGRFVAFQSVASNLVSGDTNDREDVFVRDRATGQTTRVSVSSTGTEGNDFSGGPTISQDGRIVAFTSNASNLVDGDTNNAFDAFVYDRQTGQTTRVSVSSTGAQGNGDSFASGSSADGRFVAFTSMASNLVSGDTNAHRDVFVHDRETGQTTRVSVSSSGVQGDSDSFAGIASADGRFVAFFSTASNLVPDDTNGTTDVFVHDVQTGQTSRVSVSSGGAQANGFSFSPAISADGRFVAFTSDASDLAAGDATGTDIFVHDRRTGQTSLVSADRTGVGGALFSDGAALSADGRFVSFFSFAPLTSDDSNVHEDVFIRDRLTGETRRVSVGNDGAQGNGDSVEQSLSADGRFVAFASIASNLVSGDTNLTYDTFVVGGVSIAPATVSVPAGGGSRTVDVAFAYPGTPWTAATAEPWIALTPAAGAANGTVDLSVAPNYGPARSGTVVAALQTIGVSQDAFVDVTPPIVTAPAPITVYATQLGGTTPGTSAVGVFLAAATAVDDGPAAPVQLSPMLNGAPVTTATLFALGANTVTFTFVDAAGHAATATSVVTVTGGRPSLAVRFVGTIEASVNQHATLRVTNTGAGPALKVNASLSSIRTLAGSGTVTLASGLPAGVPTGAPPASRFILPGESYDIPIGLNVPFSVSRFVLSEALTMTDSTGTPLTSTAAQTVFPAPDTTPPTITVGPAIRVTSSSATITWTTSEPASSRVDWGTGTNTNRIVPEDSVYATNHSVTITGLLPNTLYSFIVSGHDQAGNGYASSRRTARTNP
jgi:hypothetical protein